MIPNEQIRITVLSKQSIKKEKNTKSQKFFKYKQYLWNQKRAFYVRDSTRDVKREKSQILCFSNKITS